MRRAVILFAASTLAHLVVTVLALNALRLGMIPYTTRVVFLAPVVALADAPVALVAIAAAGLALAAATATAGVMLLRLKPRAGSVATAVALVSLVNAPAGTLLGLLAIGQLATPRARETLARAAAAKRA